MKSSAREALETARTMLPLKAADGNVYDRALQLAHVEAAVMTAESLERIAVGIEGLKNVVEKERGSGSDN